MVQEIHTAPTPEDYLKELVSKPNEFCIPGSSYLAKTDGWKDTNWFDTRVCLRDGMMSYIYRINKDGLRSLDNHYNAFAIRLSLHPEHVSVAADLARVTLIMKAVQPCGGSSAV